MGERVLLTICCLVRTLVGDGHSVTHFAVDSCHVEVHAETVSPVACHMRLTCILTLSLDYIARGRLSPPPVGELNRQANIAMGVSLEISGSSTTVGNRAPDPRRLWVWLRYEHGNEYAYGLQQVLVQEDYHLWAAGVDSGHSRTCNAEFDRHCVYLQSTNMSCTFALHLTCFSLPTCRP